MKPSNRSIRRAFLLSVLILSGTVEASLLVDHRVDYLKSSDLIRTTESKSKLRIDALRKELGFAHLNFWKNPELKKLEIISVPRRERNSIYLKGLVEDYGKREYYRTEFEKPMTFQPDSTLAEIDQLNGELRRSRCHQMFLGKIDLIEKQLYAAVLKKDRYKDVDANALRFNATHQGIAKHIMAYLAEHDPAQTLMGRLGHISRVEAIFGLVSRISFRNPDALGQEDFVLSLEPLASFLSGYDPFFLEAQACLISEFNFRIQDLNNKNKERSIQVQSYLKEKNQGAIRMNSFLRQLKRSQVHFLFDFFLQLRKTDVPIPDEIGKFSRWMIQNLRPHSEVVSPLERDYFYYANLNQEIYRLEESLRKSRLDQKFFNERVKEISGVSP